MIILRHRGRTRAVTAEDAVLAMVDSLAPEDAAAVTARMWHVAGQRRHQSIAIPDAVNLPDDRVVEGGRDT